MKTSTDRILTTHVGSLPRPAALRHCWCARIRARPMTRRNSTADPAGGHDIVRRQVEAGVDIVNDGEMSKPGYSTYVADRLTGFAGHKPAKPRLDTGTTRISTRPMRG